VPAKVKDVYAVYILQGVGGGGSGSGGSETKKSSASAVLPPSLFSNPSASSSSASIPRSALVFCATTQGCASLTRLLAHLGIPSAALHSALPQRERLSALDAFRGARVPLLLATDVASRGLDIPTVDLVLNYDVPADPADYVHRVGRTARAGRAGRSLTLVTQHDVRRLQKVEAALSGGGGEKGHGDSKTSTPPRQLADACLEERDVLKWITRVYSARKAAALEAADEAARGDARGKARGSGGGGGGGGEKRRR